MSTAGFSNPQACAPYTHSATPYKRACWLPVVMTAGSGNGTLTIDTTRSAPGFTVSGTAGTYTGTMPTCPKAIAISQVLKASGADTEVVNMTTLVATSGTYSFTYHANAAPATPADGVQIWFLFLCEGG